MDPVPGSSWLNLDVDRRPCPYGPPGFSRPRALVSRPRPPCDCPCPSNPSGNPNPREPMFPRLGP